MTTSTQASGVAMTSGRWKRRLAIVAGAVIAAAAVFLITSLTLGHAVRTPAMNGGALADLNIGIVVFVSALVSLLGWGLLALLEKLTPKGRVIWTVLAAMFLLVSLSGPMSGIGISTGDRVSLVLLHLTVGAVLIPFLPGVASSRAPRQVG